MKYYYQKEKQQIGPLTLEELREENIDENTLVWYSGIEKWTPLRKLNELKEILNLKEEIKYFILEDKEKKGPFYLEHFETNNLLPNTLVWTKALDNWTKAKDINELEDFIMPEIPNEVNLVDSIVNNFQGENRIVDNETLINEVEEDEKLDINSPKYHNAKVGNKGGFFKRPFSYKGRIGRLEYFLSNFIAFIIYFFIVFVIESSRNEYYGYNTYNASSELFKSILILVVYIFFIYFVVVTTAKRCHDVGNSGWYQLIPFYALILLFIPGQDENNKWGTKP